MMRTPSIHIYIGVLSVILLSSCLKDEIPVQPYDRGEALTTQVEMGSTYAYQIWFDLSTNSVKGIREKSGWDLAFDCDAAEHWVYLNSSLAAKAAITEFTDYDLVNESLVP